jgi:hypothetical protein
MLEGVSNFVPWKCRLEKLLEKVSPWSFVDTKVVEPADVSKSVDHKKDMAK